jgi:hypothetical protein
MMKVLFVGEQEAEGNVHYAVAFVGSKCFKRLVQWIREIDPDFYVTININDARSYSIIQALHADGFKLIALGCVASEALRNMEIEHLKLPHPSGLNRKLNNKKTVKEMLVTAKKYVRDQLGA